MEPERAPSRRHVLQCGVGLAGAGLGACAVTPETPDAPDARAADRRAALDELFADLADSSASVPPIAPEERAGRRERLARACADAGVDAFLTEPGATLRYLAGITWGLSERLFALVVPAQGEPFLWSPGFEAPRARGKAEAAGLGAIEVGAWQEHEYAFRPLAAELAARRIERVAVDPDLRFFAYDGLAEAHGRGRVVSGAALIRSLRMRKSEAELALLRRANELTQAALVAVAGRLRPGLTGSEIGSWVRHAQERLGLTDTWELSLVGPEAAYPHGLGNTTPLERGSVLLVDTGGALHGYQSDETRTWVFDAAPTIEVEEVWNAVRSAQQRAYDAIRPGAMAGELDRIARGTIEAAGYGSGYESFTHRLGHGIGLEVHEPPYLDGGSAQELAPGMTFSVEPGVYLYDRFGVRIEDIAAVSADGAEHFGRWQSTPLSPA